MKDIEILLRNYHTGDARVIREHALNVKVGRAIEHLDGDGGLSMRVVPRIRKIIRPGIQKMYSGAFLL
ncbi:MAG: hypothetical protein K2H31_01815 [Lachnospiraceae bacterium]|nr:hypothetical protein [Lachnospiraceae bacterium]